METTVSDSFVIEPREELFQIQGTLEGTGPVLFLNPKTGSKQDLPFLEL